MANIDEFNDDAELVGLMADPNKADPVSGNKIPLGATAEGVRDDQTAAISPGEFVIPDYAVRYHGLDFYVGSLQKAKKGLGQMEGMGLVGNPDEQTIPDETPLPDMEDEDQEFQIGGLATNTLPQTPQQQAIPTTPLPQPPAIQPIRPVSAQPVPTPQVPTTPLGVNTSQYQQGYYKEVSPGQYQLFAPPGQSATQGLVTLDQISDPSLIAPKETQYSDIYGAQAGFTKGTPQSQYLQFQGPAAGLPGGYKIDPYINDSGNVIYLTTIGGQVQGGAPPGYRKASPEDLGQTRRETPLQAPVVRPRRQPPISGGAGPVDTSEQFGAVSAEDVDTSYSFSPEYEGPMEDEFGSTLGRMDHPDFDIADKVSASYKSVGLVAPGTFEAKDVFSAIPGVGAAQGIAAFGGHSKQPSIAAHQAANGMRGSFNVGNISVHSIGTPFGVNMTVAYDAANPSRTVTPAFGEAVRGSKFGVNTYNKAFSVDKYDFNDQGTAVGKGSNPTFGAQFSYDSKTGQLATDGKGDTPGFGGTNSRGQGIDANGNVSATIGANQMRSMTPQAQVEHAARRNGVSKNGVNSQKGMLGVNTGLMSDLGKAQLDTVNGTISNHGGIQGTKDAHEEQGLPTGMYGPETKDQFDTRNAVNAINASEESGQTEGGDYRVICTELYAQGMINEDMYKLDVEFSDLYISEEVLRGYHWWAIPLVKAMRKSSTITKFVYPLANARAKEIAHIMNKEKYSQGSFLGKVVRLLGEPACYILGNFVATKDHNTLYEEGLGCQFKKI